MDIITPITGITRRIGAGGDPIGGGGADRIITVDIIMADITAVTMVTMAAEEGEAFTVVAEAEAEAFMGAAADMEQAEEGVVVEEDLAEAAEVVEATGVNAERRIGSATGMQLCFTDFSASTLQRQRIGIDRNLIIDIILGHEATRENLDCPGRSDLRGDIDGHCSPLSITRGHGFLCRAAQG